LLSVFQEARTQTKAYLKDPGSQVHIEARFQERGLFLASV